MNSIIKKGDFYIDRLTKKCGTVVGYGRVEGFSIKLNASESEANTLLADEIIVSINRKEIGEEELATSHRFDKITKEEAIKELRTMFDNILKGIEEKW